MPDYPNKDIPYERLTLAIREGKNSFGFVYLGPKKDFIKALDVRQKMRYRKIEKNISFIGQKQ